jgi:phosphoribosylformylglycinamidine cyclo-ligase
LPQQNIAAGDVVLGLASSGVHSNGFSLVRKIVTQKGLNYHDAAPFDKSKSLGEALLEPTRIYVKPALKAVKTGNVKAMAHITGGGLLENIPRVLPDGLGVWLSTPGWQASPVFHWLAEAGNIEPNEMARTFNCGIGLIMITAAENADSVMKLLEGEGEQVFRIGAVEDNAKKDRVHLLGASGVWPC